MNDAEKIAREIAEKLHFTYNTFDAYDVIDMTAMVAKHLAPLIAERDEWRAKYRQELADWAEDDTEARKLCEGILTEFEIHGDSYSVPGIVDLIAMLSIRVKHYKGTLETTLKGSFDGMQALARDNAELRAQLEKAKQALKDAQHGNEPGCN